MWNRTTASTQGLGKASDKGLQYRNHRIFTLRCISKGLTSVIIRLKTTIRTEKARKIRKGERDLLQARVMSINSLLGYNAKQRDLSRSKLASIISNNSMGKCQELIEKVSELRHSKVKQRQINKFKRLVERKEGNITWSSTQSAQVSTFPWAARASSPQAISILPQQLMLAFPGQAATPHRQLALLSGSQG